jgi:hypothetical protein
MSSSRSLARFWAGRSRLCRLPMAAAQFGDGAEIDFVVHLKNILGCSIFVCIYHRLRWELLAYVVEDVLLYGGPDSRLLDNHEEVAPSPETDQLCTRNGGGGKLSIVVELQRIVCGMEY